MFSLLRIIESNQTDIDILLDRNSSIMSSNYNHNNQTMVSNNHNNNSNHNSNTSYRSIRDANQPINILLTHQESQQLNKEEQHKKLNEKI